MIFSITSTESNFSLSVLQYLPERNNFWLRKFSKVLQRFFSLFHSVPFVFRPRSHANNEVIRGVITRPTASRRFLPRKRRNYSRNLRLPSNSSTVEFNFDETVKYSRFSHFSLYRFEYLSMNGYFFKNFIERDGYSSAITHVPSLRRYAFLYFFEAWLKLRKHGPQLKTRKVNKKKK